ncbi:hypothetical protein ACFXPM_34135 [Streptomyces sp. NPDC059095]|uniref:hypothetical protein n=1 Tax=unclassified Streptomyces TaxID=2593676 RepID=UPI0035E0EB41
MNDNPDVEITGDVYKMTFQTDRQGAVLVAYSKDTDGRIGRSWLRLSQAAADYIGARLGHAAEIRRESDAAALRVGEVQA